MIYIKFEYPNYYLFIEINNKIKMYKCNDIKNIMKMYKMTKNYENPKPTIPLVMMSKL